MEFWRLANLDLADKSDAEARKSLYARRQTLNKDVASEKNNLKHIIYSMFQVFHRMVLFMSIFVIFAILEVRDR